MSARLMLNLPTGRQMTQTQIQEWLKKEEARFNALSEEDQILYLQARKIGAACCDPRRKDDVARDQLEHEFGPKFAARILADPTSRKKLGLDKEQK